MHIAHSHILLFIVANILSLLFMWWISKASPYASPDEAMGGDLMAAMFGVILFLVDGILLGVWFVIWLIKG